VSSQPVVPYVGMSFDNEDEAQKCYNKYAYKMGFGTRICSSRFSRRRGSKKLLINRGFECVHARMGAAATTSSGSKSDSMPTKQCTAPDMSSGCKSASSHQPASAAMEMSDTR
jgi:hypothetical protein